MIRVDVTTKPLFDHHVWSIFQSSLPTLQITFLSKIYTIVSISDKEISLFQKLWDSLDYWGKVNEHNTKEINDLKVHFTNQDNHLVVKQSIIALSWL